MRRTGKLCGGCPVEMPFASILKISPKPSLPRTSRDQNLKASPENLPDGTVSKVFACAGLSNNMSSHSDAYGVRVFSCLLDFRGFKRVNNQDAPNGTLAFEHPKFNRSRPELAKEISGSKQKNAPSASTPASNAAARASGAAKSKEVSTPSGPAPAPWPIAAARQASVLPSASIMSSSQEQQQPPPRQQQQQQLLLLSSNELQPDFESQLFLRSIRNHLLTQRTAPDRLLRGTGSSNTTENQDPYSVAAILAQRQQQQQRASELSSVLSGANAPNSSLLTGNQLSSFFADNQSLSSRYQHQHPILQHHSQLSSTAAAANASPRNVDIILQMYLQQQQQQHHNNRGHVLLLLQQELLRQDMLRLEQERREQERDNQGRRSKPNGGN